MLKIAVYLHKTPLRAWEDQEEPQVEETKQPRTCVVTESALVRLAEELDAHARQGSREPFRDLLTRFFFGSGF